MTRDKKQAPAQASRGDAPAMEFPLEGRLKPQQLINYAAIAKTDAPAVEFAKLDEIIQLLWLPGGLSEQAREARIIMALDQFNAIKPTDATEGMLAAQMIGTHAAAAECLRRTMLSGQNFAARDMELKHAHKLMTLYTQQLAALDKHRGKGQQKITIERVNVESGGQAIVGHVDAGAARLAPPAEHQAPPQIAPPPQIDHAPDGLAEPQPARRPRGGRERG